MALATGVGGFEKLVAIKLIHPSYSDDEQFIRMLVDEAKLSVLLTHSNIAQTFDLGTIDGRFFIVMEYVDGVDAAKLLRRMHAAGDRMPIAAALFIAIRICQALDYAHRKTDATGRSLNVIHRDVSPHNILLSIEGEVKLTDFGIAKAASSTTETEVGVIKGKYCYMSPEQAWADPIDLRSDVYAAGAVLYEMLTGTMLVEPDENLPALLERVRAAEHVPARRLRPEIPGEVEAILEKALAPRRDDRYETAGDFAADLERALYAVDRSFNQPKLQALMAEYVPPAAFASPDAAAEQTETHVTRVEGEHAKMGSKDFRRESGTSILFTERADRADLAGTTEIEPPRSARARGDGPVGDDEDEATTFFDRDALKSGAASIEVDPDSTVVDASGDLARKLDEMVSLGGARPVPVDVVEAVADSARTRSFRPPAPLWEPLPFVGPPLDDAAAVADASAEAAGLSTLGRVALVLSALAVTALLAVWLVR